MVIAGRSLIPATEHDVAEADHDYQANSVLAGLHVGDLATDQSQDLRYPGCNGRYDCQ